MWLNPCPQAEEVSFVRSTLTSLKKKVVHIRIRYRRELNYIYSTRTVQDREKESASTQFTIMGWCIQSTACLRSCEMSRNLNRISLRKLKKKPRSFFLCLKKREKLNGIPYTRILSFKFKLPYKYPTSIYHLKSHQHV